MQANAMRPFRAVLSRETRDVPNWLVVPDDLDADHPLLWTYASCSVARTAAGLVACALPLLDASRQLLLVDRFFDPYAPRFRDTLKALLHAIAKPGRRLGRVDGI